MAFSKKSLFRRYKDAISKKLEDIMKEHFIEKLTKNYLELWSDESKLQNR